MSEKDRGTPPPSGSGAQDVPTRSIRTSSIAEDRKSINKKPSQQPSSTSSDKSKKQ